MMKANELIIGKYYKTNVEFTGSLEAKINVFKDKEYFILNKKNLLLILQFDLFKFIEPVILTEDILLKCGFIDRGSKLFDLGYFTYNLIGNTFWMGQESIRCYSLHQLQNLYFALTGEELTIKL